MTRAFGLLLEAFAMLLALIMIPVVIGILCFELLINGWKNTALGVKIAAGGIVVAALLLTVVASRGALAQEHRHPPEDAAIHETFYKNWKMPDNRDLSCCNNQDCAPVLAAEKRGGVWWAQRKSDLKWLQIPPHKIERERDAPDASAHMCSLGDHVFCFIASGGV